ncbi:hypothetical protein KI387_009700, partial [Taxus chinensis]
MERTIFWNRVGVTDTMVGCDVIGTYEVAGVDGAMLRVAGEGTVDTIGVIDVVDVAVIADVGPRCETTRGNVDEGNTKLVIDDVEVGVREGRIDMGMPYTSFLEEFSWEV